MPAHPTYFTWPDGGLRYDCRECGACCRGLGIGLESHHHTPTQILDAYPDAALFLRLRGNTWTMANPRAGCWFLDPELRCRIESEHGRDHKPGACKLFPFNRVFRCGEQRVVDYNPVICPLEVVNAHGVSHSSVLADLDAISDPSLTQSLPTTLPTDFLQREHHLSLRLFAQAQRLLTSPDPSSIPLDDVLAQAHRAFAVTTSDGRPPRLAAEAIACLFPTPPPPPSPRTLVSALTACPSLRFNEAFGQDPVLHGAHMALRWPQLWPLWLNALALGEKMAARHLTLQDVTTLWTETKALWWWLAAWEEPFLWQGGESPDVGAFTPLHQHAQAIALAITAAAGTRPLGAILSAHLPAHFAQRVAVLRLLEPLLPRLRPAPASAPWLKAPGRGAKKRPLGRRS